MVTSRGQNITAEQLSQVTLNWEAIGYEDERTPQPPTGYDQPSPGFDDSSNQNSLKQPGSNLVPTPGNNFPTVQVG